MHDWYVGIQGKATTDGESEDEVPFMAQEERRPLHRVRKTMQLHDVDSRLRDMRYAVTPPHPLFACFHYQRSPHA